MEVGSPSAMSDVDGMEVGSPTAMSISDMKMYINVFVVDWLNKWMKLWLHSTPFGCLICDGMGISRKRELVKAIYITLII